jgi:hypothetical protein
VFINQFSRHALGRLGPAIYWGGRDGFTADRKTNLPGLGAAAAVACDVNDDGHADLVVVNCAENALELDEGSYLFYGSEKGFPAKPSMMIPTRTPMAVATGDINRDGYLDLIFSCYGHGELTIFFGCEGGFDLEHPQKIRIEEEGKVYKEGRRMCLADLNNDGWLDLVVTDCGGDRCFILWGGAEGFSFERRQALSVIRSSCPHAVDLTGNGYLDLLIGGHTSRDTAEPPESFVHIYWNGPEGIREDRKTLLPANGVLAMALADLNNDGRLDLFVGSYHDGRDRDIDSFIYWGQADGTFSAKKRTRLRTHSASGVIAADFNEDGWIDLAISNHKTFGDHRGESFVWWNGPEGFDRKNITALPTAGPHGMMHVGPGNQRDRGEQEYYVSEPYELPAGAKVTEIAWEAELGPKTWVKAQLRAAETKAGLEKSPWHGAGGQRSWYHSPGAATVSSGRWIQYRLALGAKNSGSTPRVREVRVIYA